MAELYASPRRHARKNAAAQGCIQIELGKLREGRYFPAIRAGGTFMPPSLCLLDALGLVPDPRDRRGRIHPLEAIREDQAAFAGFLGCLNGGVGLS
jgi:hypothetical protein